MKPTNESLNRRTINHAYIYILCYLHRFFWDSPWSQWTDCYKILPPVDIEHCNWKIALLHFNGPEKSNGYIRYFYRLRMAVKPWSLCPHAATQGSRAGVKSILTWSDRVTNWGGHGLNGATRVPIVDFKWEYKFNLSVRDNFQFKIPQNWCNVPLARWSWICEFHRDLSESHTDGPGAPVLTLWHLFQIFYEDNPIFHNDFYRQFF